MKIKLKKNKGILFWITGLSGVGKTSIAKKIHKEIIKNYGPTILFSGDDLRSIFQIKTYDKKNRYKLAKQYSSFCKSIVDQNINVIFATISLFHDIQKDNQKKIDNYVEIFIKSDFKKVSKLSKKKIYLNLNEEKNIWGKNLKPEFPKKPNIVIMNNFNENLILLSNRILSKIQKAIKF